MQTRRGISSGIINVALDYGFRRGITQQQLQQSVPTLLMRRGNAEHYPIADACGLLNELLRLTDLSPAVPCEALASVRCGDYGILGFLLLSAPDASIGLERFVRLHSLAVPSGTWVLRNAREGLHLAYDIGQLEPVLNSAWEQAAVTTCVAALRDAFGPLSIERICFRGRAPRTTTVHKQYFACPLHFGAEETCVAVRYDLLRRRPRLSDVDMFRFLDNHANAEAKAAAAPMSFPECVRTAILAALEAGDMSVAVIARQMGMSERTLRRRLDAHGHSFRKLVDETRIIVADGLLLDPERTVTDVAAALGFSEVSAFSRAYRRLRGNAPRRGRA